ncbi:MAG: DUF2461 domain-containing protein [Vulcanimicrobiaceae bacterium]
MREPIRAFEGFSAGGLRLLAALARHNDRTWFAQRKERFEAELLTPMRALVVDASAALARARIPLYGDPRRSLFRIYRDVRFGHDKTPYRTHLAAYLSLDGERGTPGGIYVHVEPRRSFLSAAFYRIDGPMLRRWRDEMVARPDRFLRVLAATAANGLAFDGPADSDDALARIARIARGYEAHTHTAIAPYLRLRSFCANATVDDESLRSPALVERIVATTRAARPLLEYGWAVR